VDVAGHRDGAALVGGVGDAVERLGGVLPGWIIAAKLIGDGISGLAA
jgi:hypothetical protein